MASHADLFKGTLRLLGVLATGETLDADQQADCLTSFNDLLDSWSTEKLIIPNRVREEFPLVASQSAYTMGPSGDFDTTRPLDIESAKIEIQGSDSYELPVEIINSEEWAEISDKDLTSDNPSKLYVEFTATTVTLRVWPVPTSTNKLVLHSWKALTSVVSAATTVAYPPGYSEALKYNLALRLAPEYGKALDQSIIILAQELKSNIKRANTKPEYMVSDYQMGLQNHFDINKGY